jgi:hypothetical protein
MKSIKVEPEIDKTKEELFAPAEIELKISSCLYLPRAERTEMLVIQLRESRTCI